MTLVSVNSSKLASALRKLSQCGVDLASAYLVSNFEELLPRLSVLVVLRRIHLEYYGFEEWMIALGVGEDV